MDKEKRKKISKIGRVFACIVFSLLLVTFLIISCIPSYASVTQVWLGHQWSAPQKASVYIMNKEYIEWTPNSFNIPIPQVSFEPTDIDYFPRGEICTSSSWSSSTGLGTLNSYQYFAETIYHDWASELGNNRWGYQYENNVVTAFDIGLNGKEQVFGISYGNFYYFNDTFYSNFEKGDFPDNGYKYVFDLEVNIPRREYYNMNGEFQNFPTWDYELSTNLHNQTGTMMICFPIGIGYSGIDGNGIDIGSYNPVKLKSNITVCLVGTNFKETFDIEYNNDGNSHIMSRDFTYTQNSTGKQEPFENVGQWYIDLNKNDDIKEWACECLEIDISEYNNKPVLFYVEEVNIYYNIEPGDSYPGTDPSKRCIITQTTNSYNVELMEMIYNFDNTPDIIEIPPEHPTNPDNDDMIGNMDISSTIALTSWLGNAISGFFDTTIVAGMTIGGIFILVISFALVMWFLKLFAGG